ncbi:MAG: carboxypeptidase regulatory-like domain-containing protein [Pyrinomonadaceae bacterium]
MSHHLRRGLCGLFTALLICLCLSGAAWAQEETAAAITGQVTDAAGGAIPNATIVVSNKATNFERRVQSGDDGGYTVSPLPPGQYTVTVEQPNFKRYVQEVVLNAKDRRPIDIVLEAGNVSETVTVTSDLQGVQDSPIVQGLVNEKQVRELPLVNRDFLKLLESGIPGISSDLADETSLGLTNRTSVSINGMRRNGVNYLVDGVNNVDGGSNITLLTTPTIDSIQEFKVLTSNYTAETGRSGSGVVTLVTKGGGNNFHGSLYEFARNDRFNANTFFNNRVPRRADGTRSPGTATPRLRYNNFGGTISGPVYLPHFGEGGPRIYNGKDKTFFFFSQEFRRIRRGTTAATALVPTAAQRAGDFSANLGNPLYLQANGTSGTTVTATPLFVTDTTGAVVAARAGQVFNTAGRAYANNMIPGSDISPLAQAFFSAYPLPNVGTNGFTYTSVAEQNTRQEVVRIDHNFSDNERLFGRYTHDLNQTTEPAGLFNSINLPGIATTATNIPGQVMAVSLTSIISPTVVNEVAYNFSQNHIKSNLIGRSLREQYPGSGSIPEFYPENNIGAIPTLNISGIETIGGAQQPDIRYRNNLFRDTLTLTHGGHTLKFGGEMAFEGKNENVGTGSLTQGSFSFTQSGSLGRSTTNVNLSQGGIGFASFLLGRADSYSEDQFDVTNILKLGRREAFAQDTWKYRPNITLDFGVRYQYFLPPTDKHNLLNSFIPSRFNRANIPACTTSLCTALVRGSGDPLNGLVLAGVNSPFGNAVTPKDKNNFSPRVGFAWDPFKDGRTSIRGGYGFYYDQVASFLVQDASQVNPPFVNRATFSSNVTLANPSGGVSSVTGALPILSVVGIDPNFVTPEIQQWSLGVQREVWHNALLEVSYVGTKGDHLLDRRNINFVSPADTQAFFTANNSTNVNSIRPFRGFGTVTLIETAAISRYHGLLSSFNYRFGSGNTVNVAYTFSKNMTDFTNDRDAVDAPQNPFNLLAEYAEARSSRPHIFSASYIYELPFFRKSENKAARWFLSGYQISGITNIESGNPVSRVLASTTTTGRRGNRSQLVGDPNGGLNDTIDPVTGLPFYYDPNAFADPVLGTYGNSGRAILRNPGRNQTNLRVSRSFNLNSEKGRTFQVFVEAINAFNHTQFTVIQNQLGLSNTGRPTGARLPREFQFAGKFYF